jgi:hypothetical protein
MAMVPHERSLVTKLEGKPFALIGVNLDNSRQQMKQVEQKQQINWRSFFDGRGGPIGKDYKIRALPTIYVLDEKGVIRYRNVRGPAMDKAVETLLKNMGSGG